MARKSRVQRNLQEEFERKKEALVGIYSRLSDEDGDDEKQNSIGNQRKIGLDFLSAREDMRLVDTYTDNGYTGMNYHRPGFERMLSDLRLGRINCVLIKDISRLGRHFVLTSELVERRFPEMSVRLISINDEYDSADPAADASALTLPLKMVMNDYYVKDISRKIRSSIDTKIQDGEFLPSSGSIPYGYIRNQEENTFDVDEETAPVVKYIFELRSQGLKFNAIAKRLNEENIPCPGKVRYMRGITMKNCYADAQWIRGTIRKITNDIVYLGHRVHGKIKRDKVGLEKTARDASQWQIIENAHSAIIPQALFDLVQQVNHEELALLDGYKQRADAAVDYRELFRGKIICGDCGSAMTSGKGCARPNAKTPSRIFYDCSKYKSTQHASCGSHYVRQETLMNAIRHLLDQQVRLCVDIEQLILEVQKMPVVSDYEKSAKASYRSVTSKRVTHEAKIERLLADFTEGLITREEYLFIKQRYATELDRLLEEEAKAAAGANKWDGVLSSTRQWLNSLSRYQSIPVIDRKLLDELVDSVEVFNCQHIKVNLRYADPYLPIRQYLQEIEVMQNAG